MNGPNVSMLVALSALSSGVPVKPMNMAPGSSRFMAECISPDWVRWASSTKTNRLPLAEKSFGMKALNSLMKSAATSSWFLSLPAARNLWTSEQMSHSWLLLSVAMRSAPLMVR